MNKHTKKKKTQLTSLYLPNISEVKTETTASITEMLQNAVGWRDYSYLENTKVIWFIFYFM